MLLRVQIKLSAGVGCTRVTGPMATKWVNKLKVSSAEICGPLAAALGGGAEVEARHIMWVAQDMCATARAGLRLATTSRGQPQLYPTPPFWLKPAAQASANPIREA